MASTSEEEASGRKVSTTTRVRQIMANHPQLGCLVLAVALTVLSQYAKCVSKPFILPQPPPRRFFRATSPVLDYPYGNIGDVGHLLTREEALFVMYYAPWCAKSKRTRTEFEKAAAYLKDDIRFVAVNCWYPNGTCRQQNNFIGYPALFFYHTHLESYRYQGVLKAEYIVEFVEHLLQPLTYLRNKEELAMFLAERDNAVVGFFDFNSSPQPPGFQQFYYAAVRTYAIDCKNPVEFTVITDGAMATDLNMDGSGTIHLIRSLNLSLVYPLSNNITSSSLLQWAHMYKQEPAVSWMLPTGMKSLILSSTIKQSPALILFVPNFPLDPNNQYVAMLREISMDYNNCENRTKVSNLINSLKYAQWINAIKQLDLSQLCVKNLDDLPPCGKERQLDRTIPTKRCCQSVMVESNKREYNSCDICHNYLATNPASWRACDMRPVVDEPTWSLIKGSFPDHQGMCMDVLSFYNPGEFLTVCCENHSFYHTPARLQYNPRVKTNAEQRRSNDPFVLEMTRNWVKKQCKKLNFRRQQAWESSNQFLPGSVDPRVTGLSCLTNKSLTFLAMDSRWSKPFMERLGIKFKQKLKEPVAVIYDKRAEAQYLLNSPVTKATLVEFIQNYTDGTLPAYRRSATLSQADDPCRDDGDGSRVCIVDVNSNNFEQVVMDANKDVVLMFYAPWCGFCAGFAHVYLSLAKYFRSTKNIIFARINADVNDLPWEFTVDVYPTITLFPANRKENSATFPDHLKKTLPNLIYFILHYGSQSLKLETGLSICTSSCIKANMEAAVQRIQSLNRAINAMEHRLTKLQRQIKRYPEQSAPPVDDESLAFYKDGSSLLKWYEVKLRQRLLFKRLAKDQARHLHRELVATSGVFIERHRLVRLLNRHRKDQQQHSHILRAEGRPADDDSTEFGLDEVPEDGARQEVVLDGQEVVLDGRPRNEL